MLYGTNESPGEKRFLKLKLSARCSGREGMSMTLSETYMMLTFLFAALALLVQVVGTTFDIVWKISHDKRDDDNKKSE